MAPTLSRNHTAIVVLERWPVFKFASGYCLVHVFPLLDLVCWSSCLEKKILLLYLKHRYLIYSPLFNSSGNLSNFLEKRKKRGKKRTWRPAEPQVEAVQVSWGLLGPMGCQAMAVFPGLTHKGCSATPVCAVLPHETPRSNLDSLIQVHRCPERPKLSQSPPKELLLLITNRHYCLIKI